MKTTANSFGVVSLFAVAVALFAACDTAIEEDGVVKRKGQPDIVREFDDDLMDRAMQRSRDTHLEFVEALSAENPDHRGFAVKRAYPVGEEGAEHIWINEVSWDGSLFSGVINNEPVDTTAVKVGDQVTVKPDALSDWMYIDGATLVGGYTVRVLHFQSPPEQQKQFEKQTGMKIPPIDF